MAPLGGSGCPATNKLLRKLEEAPLALWLEEEMLQRFGSQEQAKRELFARSASRGNQALAYEVIVNIYEPLVDRRSSRQQLQPEGYAQPSERRSQGYE